MGSLSKQTLSLIWGVREVRQGGRMCVRGSQNRVPHYLDTPEGDICGAQVLPQSH